MIGEFGSILHEMSSQKPLVFVADHLYATGMFALLIKYIRIGVLCRKWKRTTISFEFITLTI